ncbi:Y-family DNA polymerase [Puniceicoccus vermicola]|uniref:DNA polymerase Y family protein n=1 Tax=Puniceicoccus vermicola TaxID=388746 RepID=A0A7X1B0B0_9BACT|nr:DNA polymerase Y family protein [Puniceicoccus vermicola]
MAVREDRTSVLACVDDEARKQGVAPGMSTARALARCSHLAVLEKNPSAEESAMGWLIALGFGVSPRVEATAAGEVTVDLRGVKNLEEMAGQIADRADRAGIAIRVGISDTPERAQWASYGRSHLSHAVTDEGLFGGMGLHEIPLPAEILRRLREWGLTCLLEFVRFAKGAVASRLGPEGVLLWERMKGRRARLLTVIEEPPVFRREMELEHRVETLDQALFIIRRLLEEVCSSLLAAGKIARSLELFWRTEAKVEGGHGFALPEATARVTPLFAMIEAYLSGVRTEAALQLIGLEAEPGDPLPEQRDFFEISAKSPFQFQETVGRIQGFLGEEKVGVPVREPTHHPDACELVPASTRIQVEEGAMTYGKNLGPALRRFRPPRPIEVWCEEGRPVRCIWKRSSHRIQAVRGPWRISGDWWDPRYRWSQEEWDVEWGSQFFCRLVRVPSGKWRWEGVYD